MSIEEAWAYLRTFIDRTAQGPAKALALAVLEEAIDEHLVIGGIAEECGWARHTELRRRIEALA